MEASQILVSYEGPLQIIQFNRPEKKNAISSEGYNIIRNALKSAQDNEDIKITLITGVGEYFSSGNDFSTNGIMVADEDMETAIRRSVTPTRDFILSLIDYPKIIIALVNGPAIGIAVTVLPLFDLVYALDSATFRTPFTSMGITAEGCSTYTFPRSLGKSLASKMLYFNYTMNAEEAKNCGFVADILKSSEIPEFKKEIAILTQLPLKSLMGIKKMLRSHDLKSLHYANSLEIEILIKSFQSEEFMNRMIEMMMKKKSKL